MQSWHIILNTPCRPIKLQDPCRPATEGREHPARGPSCRWQLTLQLGLGVNVHRSRAREATAAAVVGVAVAVPAPRDGSDGRGAALLRGHPDALHLGRVEEAQVVPQQARAQLLAVELEQLQHRRLEGREPRRLVLDPQHRREVRVHLVPRKLYRAGLGAQHRARLPHNNDNMRISRGGGGGGKGVLIQQGGGGLDETEAFGQQKQRSPEEEEEERRNVALRQGKEGKEALEGMGVG